MNIEMLDHAGISEYNPVEVGLQELRRKYANVAVDVTTPKALEEAKRVRAEIREPRYECEKIRKALKAPALAHAKLIDTEAARITAELLAIETPWDDAIKAEEQRKEVEKEAKAAAERARIMDINEKIAHLRGFVSLALECRTSERVASLIARLNLELSEDDYQEFIGEATQVRDAALARMVEIHDARVADEAERARVKAEQEALRIEREAFAAAQLEAKRVADEAAAKAQAAAEEMAAQRAAFEAEQEAARKNLVAQASLIALERAALEAAKTTPETQEEQPLAHVECAQAAIETVALSEGLSDLLDSRPMELSSQPMSIAIDPPSPTVEALIEAVAKEFDVTMGTAAYWLMNAADDIANFE